MRPADATLHDQRSVTLVGNGNIGSHFVPLIGRMRNVRRVTLIDFDNYEAGNLRSQDIRPSDVGRPKVEVQARRLRIINPGLEVEPLCCRMERAPLALLRGSVIVAGLDSRISRQHVNNAAWRLGMPLIDGAVDGGDLLARVDVYFPGDDHPCLECRWDEADYAALEQGVPCQNHSAAAPATNAPSALGAVAAGLMAIECQKLLAGDQQHLLRSRQVLLDLRHHTHFVTAFRRNPQCRFDHRTWEIELADPPAKLSLRQILELAAGKSASSWSSCAIQLENHNFVRKLVCASCGRSSRQNPFLTDRLAGRRRTCSTCGQQLAPRGCDMIEWLEGATLSAADCRRLLSRIGFRLGDVVSVRTPNRVRHYQLGGPNLRAANHGEAIHERRSV